MSFHVGEDLGDYKIVAIIGAGSIGRVFQVEHRLTKRKEAAKVLSAELATETQIQRFEREIALQSRLTHPNIASVHNAFSWEGYLILITEFLEGQTLEKLLSRGRLPVEQGIDYVRQTLSALAYAHDQRVVHRDVSPANLIITPAGVVKLTDFGVSKSFGDIRLTNCGDIVGNLDYMAPEQARGSSYADFRSDLYSLGAILYEILTGRKPFGEGRKFAPLVTDSESDPPLPTELEPLIQPQWNDVVGKAMMRDRELRYSTASDFLAAIEQAAPVSPAETSLPGTAKRWWFPVSGASITAAGLLLPMIVSSVNRFGRVPPAPEITFHIPSPGVEALQRSMSATLPSAEEPPIQQNRGLRHRAIQTPPSSVAQSISSQPTETAPSKVKKAVSSSESSAPSHQEQNEAKKKRFWSKLNPFKKKAPSTPD